MTGLHLDLLRMPPCGSSTAGTPRRGPRRGGHTATADATASASADATRTAQPRTVVATNPARVTQRSALGNSSPSPLPLPRHINSSAELLSQPTRQRPRGDTSRLSVPDQPAGAAPGLEAELRQLGGLTRPRRATNNHNGMASERLENFNSMCRDG